MNILAQQYTLIKTGNKKPSRWDKQKSEALPDLSALNDEHVCAIYLLAYDKERGINDGVFQPLTKADCHSLIMQLSGALIDDDNE